MDTSKEFNSKDWEERLRKELKRRGLQFDNSVKNKRKRILKIR